MKIAVTGATGFVGASLLEVLKREDANVSVLVRDQKRLSPSCDVGIVVGDLSDEKALGALCDGADAVLHLAGVTHPRDDAAYQSVNVDGARRVAQTAAAAGAKLVHVSSLSAREREASPYAASKRASEECLADIGGDWRAIRLPAIYGPRDTATLPYFRLVARGLALEPRTPVPARASLLFVEDAGRSLLAALNAPAGGVYEVGDDQPDGRAWRDIGETLAATLDRPVRAVRVPRFVVAGAHHVIRLGERGLGGARTVRTQQVNEFFHADWVARNNLLSAATSWQAEMDLKTGFAKTAHWYRENGLL